MGQAAHSAGQVIFKLKEVRMTKEDVEDTSGEGEQECWFSEGGCLELSEMESGSWRDWC